MNSRDSQRCQGITHTTACSHSLSCTLIHALSNTGQLGSVCEVRRLCFCIIIACRLFATSLCGRVPFLFPAQAPLRGCVPLLIRAQALVWPCSLPIPCSSSLHGCVPLLIRAQALVWPCSLPIPCSSSLRGCVPFPFPAPCVAVFPSHFLLKLLAWLCSLPISCSSSFRGCVPFPFPAQALAWLCSLPISSLRGCVPFPFPAQAPCVAVFPSHFLLKLLVWLCSLPSPMQLMDSPCSTVVQWNP